MSEELTFSCPHCQHQFNDELELLAANELHAIQCENCDTPFTFLLKECLACSEETVFVWAEPPSEILISRLQCHACETPFQPDEEIENGR
ncbi:hypothetical protein LT85_p028 (plasmid) [Collimonas arenae]|uniref:Uncharacterized protein n=1 Tax=Collimonas arenae TaxID=279058 RepID=A0A0A1FMM9_9BURK|nr:hypothetical protein [Collimonas arenae]AIY44207.1 hypothetical protein LT85_p028 [Collimonas arenae]